MFFDQKIAREPQAPARRVGIGREIAFLHFFVWVHPGTPFPPYRPQNIYVRMLFFIFSSFS